ncbi:MAG: efflux RND transporter periplasmic adaptor subunit [Syntrophobacterales bacterium]|nr:efflux RND transporter periplasmic adaptor subunit [Syntrophobacterales bacterium]
MKEIAYRGSKLILLSGVVLIVLVILLGVNLFRKPSLPEGLIQANGRIEGDRFTISSKVPGKVVRLYVREGDGVGEGQVVAKLDDAQISAKVDQAREAVSTLEAQFRAAKLSLEVLKRDVPLTVETARSTLAQARSHWASAQVKAKQAERDALRFQHLFGAGAIDKHRFEQIDLARQVAFYQLRAAEESIRTAEKQLAQTLLGYDRIKVKEAEVEALSAQLAQAKATLREAESTLDDLIIKAPTSGIITSRMVDIGEVITAGAPIMDVVNLDRLYLQVYIPEKEIGKIRLGLPARIYVDALPEIFLTATVRYIASRAQFTPKEVQTPDERVKLVFAVRLYLDENPDHRLTPGLPADAVIKWKEEVPWTKPRW